jgi:hypothetical protein
MEAEAPGCFGPEPAATRAVTEEPGPSGDERMA